MGMTCPACHAADTQALVDLGVAPVLCGVTWDNPEAARSSPSARIVLENCPECAHVRNGMFEEALVSYEESYDNTLHHSPTFGLFAEVLAQRIAASYDLRGKHVLEIGCGKGEFLETLCRYAGCRATGYDPSYDGRSHHPQITFVRETADFRQVPEFDFFVSRHVLEHLQDPQTLLLELAEASAGRTVYGYLEVPDAMYDFERSGWDCNYEQVSYFCATSLRRLVERCGFRLVRLLRTFGGEFLSLEVASEGHAPPVPLVVQGMGIQREREILESFGARRGRSVADWRGRLRALAPDRTVFWGAGVRGVSFLNAMDPQCSLAAVVDINPGKWGRYLPVTGHRVVSPDELARYEIETVLIANAIYEREIVDRLYELGIAATVICVDEATALDGTIT